MAQRDIEAIAEQMRLEEKAKQEYDEAYAKMQEEQKKFEAEEFEELEDEIIDPASMGFVDSEDIECSEADDFYNEEDKAAAQLNESIQDCLEKNPVEEAEDQGSIEVDVYNEDGFGEHFASEVMKFAPGTIAVVKKAKLSNGDIRVKISGSRPDLEKAFAFYVGEKCFEDVSRDDKEEFESLLVFDDGDTLAEADYREAVAHCLDPVGVDASTANLINQDTCAISMVKEEKAKRTAKKIIKALNEEDLSELSDKDLDSLEGIQDAIQSGEGAEGMNDDELRVWKALLATMGYTLEEWNKLSPEEQDKVWKAQDELRGQLSKSGFARWHTGVDSKTGKKFRYQNQYMDFIPQADDELGLHAGQRVPTAFNPDYTSELSRYQHPTTFAKKDREAAAKAEEEQMQKRRKEAAKKALLHARSKTDDHGKPAITPGDLSQMMADMTQEEREQLMNELIQYSRETAASPEDAKNEQRAIKSVFAIAKPGKKTLEDLANMLTGGTSGAPGAINFMLNFEIALKNAIRKVNPDMGNDSIEIELGKVMNDPVMKEKFKKIFPMILNSRKSGKVPMDPERAERRKEWIAMLKKMGYNPTRWADLSTDEQLNLMDKYFSKNAQK